ncbi:MAG: hypothetical protein Q8922_01600 [Bacteroidota bacterium]|nr:hypothetical protein [Bacteroidota bacterium]MDP4232078.1 hypothetical protein [Bacteroidota bacterium]MDP4241215.1 hypothetical protein [Bacteroidota bacterium]MDP4286607.1 hypothetical protein [Bacteroidota bacterium]
MIERLTLISLIVVCFVGCSSSPTPTDPNSGSGAGNGGKGTLTFVSTLDFGNIPPGNFADSTISLTNSGKDTIHILHHSLSNGRFLLFDTAAITLKPGASAVVRYRFQPIDTLAQSATDTIVTDGSPKTYLLTLKGRGYHHSVSTGPTTVPNAGSIFYYNIYEIDSSGVKLPGSDWPDTNTVRLTGLSRFGKNNVSDIIQAEKDINFIADDTVNYESNGDISEWLSSQEVSNTEGWTYPCWQRIPVGASSGSSPIITVLLDTVVGGVHTQVTHSYQSFGSESITVPAGTFAAVKMQYVNSFVRSVGYNSSDTTMAWYAPSLGTYLRSVHPWRPNSRPGYVFELVDYKLR